MNLKGLGFVQRKKENNTHQENVLSSNAFTLELIFKTLNITLHSFIVLCIYKLYTD